MDSSLVLCDLLISTIFSSAYSSQAKLDIRLKSLRSFFNISSSAYSSQAKLNIWPRSSSSLFNFSSIALSAYSSRAKLGSRFSSSCVSCFNFSSLVSSAYSRQANLHIRLRSSSFFWLYSKYFQVPIRVRPSSVNFGLLVFLIQLFRNTSKCLFESGNIRPSTFIFMFLVDLFCNSFKGLYESGKVQTVNFYLLSNSMKVKQFGQ